jgi:hypothetical protein
MAAMQAIAAGFFHPSLEWQPILLDERLVASVRAGYARA